MAKILVIDDDAGFRELLVTVLAHEGHNAASVDNAREAIARQLAEPAELIITDILMPEMDGIQLMLRLRKADPECPVIAMSGDDTEEQRQRMAAIAGPRHTLIKPFRMDHLLDIVDDALAGSCVAARS